VLNITANIKKKEVEKKLKEIPQARQHQEGSDWP
jgi:hypothetical protein